MGLKPIERFMLRIIVDAKVALRKVINLDDLKNEENVKAFDRPLSSPSFPDPNNPNSFNPPTFTSLEMAAPTGPFTKKSLHNLYIKTMEEEKERYDKFPMNSVFKLLHNLFPSMQALGYNSRHYRQYLFTFPPINTMRKDWRSKSRHSNWNFDSSSV
jgi:hypothetical protein